MKLSDDVPKLKFRPAGARCPGCGHRPALRFHPIEKHLHRRLDRTLVVASYQCHRRGCNEVYAIMVKDLLREN